MLIISWKLSRISIIEVWAIQYTEPTNIHGLDQIGQFEDSQPKEAMYTPLADVAILHVFLGQKVDANSDQSDKKQNSLLLKE